MEQPAEPIGGSAWVSKSHGEGLRDFWAACEAHYEAAAVENERELTSHPELGPMMRDTGVTAFVGQTAAERTLLRQAVAGDWGPYEATLRALGATYARLGISLRACHDAVFGFWQRLVPPVVRAYRDSPARLIGAIAAMQQLHERRMCVLDEGYLRTREALAFEAHAARSRAEDRLTRLTESGIIGIIVADLDGTIVEINDALLSLLGFTREEVLAPSFRWSERTPPEWRALDVPAVEQLATAGVAEIREKEYFRKDASRVAVLVGSAMLEKEERRTVSFVVDISERKKAAATIEVLRRERDTEIRLRESEERFRLLVEGVKDYAIFMLDPSGNVASWNAGAERIKGYRADEIVGQHFSRFYTSEDVAHGKPETLLRIAATEGRSEVEEGWRVRKDGSRFLANVVLTRVSDPHGKLLGFSKVTRDVTERHAAEVALKVANRELEAFSYSVAHDLRAPLRGMNGFARLLVDGYKDKLDAEGQDWLLEILTNARKMGELIDGLLSLARVSRTELKLERVDMSALVRQLGAELARDAPERHVEIVVQADVFADGDPRLVRALLTNLLGNAWKFTSRSPAARVEFGTALADGAGAYFVRDNGAGFDMAYAKKLFAPFQRLHATDEFAGTGIGLATVQRIVHRHGGVVWAEARVNEGATIYFTLDKGTAERGTS